MRLPFLALSLLVLTSCSVMPRVTPGNDPGAELEKLDGPNVKGVGDTLEKSAEEALEEGDVKRAAQFYKQLYDLPKLQEDRKSSYAAKLSEALRRAGDEEGALKYANAALKLSPQSAEAQEALGLAFIADGKPQDAGRALEKAMKTDPKRWRTLNGLGILFMTRNMVPEAMAYFSEALKYSADNPSVLNNVGLSYAAEKRFDRALEALRQAARYASGDGLRKRQVELNTAMVLGISGDIDAARDLAGKYLSGPALDNNLGLYAHLADNDELARAYLNTALSGSPMHYQRAWENLELVTSQSKGGAAK